MPLFNTRRDPTAAAPLTRQPIDLKRLLAVYDDYPNVTNALDIANDRVVQAEEAARIAVENRDVAQQELEDERKGRKAEVEKAKLDKEQAAKQAKKEKDDAEKAREDKVRKELNPKIADLEVKLKTMTEQRDKLDKELKEKRAQMEGWIGSLEKLSLERKTGYEKEKKAMEERWEAEAKTQTLDEEILEGLRNASKVPLPVTEDVDSKSASIRTRSEKPTSTNTRSEKPTSVRTKSVKNASII
ncbi:uncharacterized protein IL334_005778 [Kwoniella shivajii]|uniref:Autophagy-related protein 16 domain-containing protein n=1 Tax=Kwoniella shivajii TaxID=564305 RepID=A0ABZ1D434_9TREE|nr:hypothetical protein IL334_005778 [Kwoniella shivajii]